MNIGGALPDAPLGPHVCGASPFVPPSAGCAGRARASETFGRIYSLDMLGSAAGALMTTIILLPLYGIANTLFLLAALNLIAVVPSRNQRISTSVKQ